MIIQTILFYSLFRSEKKKLKELQREVDKMAAMMKDDEDEDAEEKEEAAQDEPDAEDSDTEEESDTDTEDETESESEPEVCVAYLQHLNPFHLYSTLTRTIYVISQDAPAEKKKANYEPRMKRHEGRLTALKKGNLLHQTNVDRLLDEINKIRDNSVTLQHDLDSVLSELG